MMTGVMAASSSQDMPDRIAGSDRRIEPRAGAANRTRSRSAGGPPSSSPLGADGNGPRVEALGPTVRLDRRIEEVAAVHAAPDIQPDHLLLAAYQPIQHRQPTAASAFHGDTPPVRSSPQ